MRKTKWCLHAKTSGIVTARAYSGLLEVPGFHPKFVTTWDERGLWGALHRCRGSSLIACDILDQRRGARSHTGSRKMLDFSKSENQPLLSE